MKQACEHCKVIFSPMAPGERFCCGGCQAVAGLLAREGLEEFYRRRDAPGQPVGELPQVNVSWAKDAQAAAEAEAEADSVTPAGGHLRIEVEGMTCAGCAWLIECLFNREKGANRAAVSLTGGYLDMWWKKDAGFRLADFITRLAGYGYRAKAYRRSRIRAVLAPHGYFAMGLIFSLNAGFLIWLNRLSQQEGQAETSLRIVLNGLLVVSLFAGAACWLIWVYRLRRKRIGKGAVA